MRTTLIIPTLNEVDGVKAIMPRIDRAWCDEIVVVDGGSTDGTVEWLRENGWQVVIQKQRGLGNAYRQVHATTTGDVIVTFSPDGNSIPELIPALIEEMQKGYDMVIVSRYLHGAKSDDDDHLTSWGNRLFTFLINRCFGGEYTDSLVIFRGYRRDLLSRCHIDAHHMTYEAQISIRAARYGLKIGEIPGDEPKRIGGTRKMSPFGTGFAILQEIGKNLVLSRPRGI
jgi:glycosyltransferase involved in cell wall biosynthesis